jgi:hypothetical protein
MTSFRTPTRFLFFDEIIYFCSHIFRISKIIPIASFSARVITLTQYPITILDCRLNSRIPRFNWLKSQSYDACREMRNRDNFRYRRMCQYRRNFLPKSFRRCWPPPCILFYLFYKNRNFMQSKNEYIPHRIDSSIQSSLSLISY